MRGTQPARLLTLPDASSAARNACSRKGSPSPVRRSHASAATSVIAVYDFYARQGGNVRREAKKVARLAAS